MPSEDKTPNYGLNQWQGNEYPKRQDFVDDNLIIDAEIKKAQDKAEQAFQSASEGKQKIATAITGKGVPTNSSATFQTMANNIEAIETDPSVGTTDAIAADLLSGKKAVSQGNLLIGTMPNRGAVNQNLTTEGAEYTVPVGYHSGLGKIKAAITGLVASVIKAGAVVGGIAGSFTADATATAAQMLAGAIAYVNGNKITGTIPSKTAQTYTPGTTNQTIAANQFLSGIQTILGSANLIAANIKKGVNIFNVIGTFSDIRNFSTNDLVMNAYDEQRISGSYSPSPTTPTFVISDMLFLISLTVASQVNVTGSEVFYVKPADSSWVTANKSWDKGTGVNTQKVYLFFNPSSVPLTFTKNTPDTAYEFRSFRLIK